MAEPPEFWTFIGANFMVFGFGAILTGVSFYTYYTRGRSRSFRDSTIGFLLLTLGGLVDPVYQLGLKGDYHLGGREMLMLQSVEGVLIGAGLGMLFYAIYRHDRSRGRRRVETTLRDAEDLTE